MSFNITTDIFNVYEETIIFSDESQYRISAVSGNKDYILYEKNENEK